MTPARASTVSMPAFRPVTRSSWDLLTPLALLVLGAIGVAFIYSAQLSVLQARGAGTSWLRQDWFKQIVFLGAGGVVYYVVSQIDYRFWLQTGGSS